MQKISNVLEKYTSPIIKKRGFYESKIISSWDDIVGVEIGQYSVPRKIFFPKDTNSKGTLYIDSYNGSAATELSFMEEIVIEKLRIFFGFEVISKLIIKQKPRIVDEKTNFSVNEEVLIDDSSSDYIASVVNDIEDDDLKKSLTFIGFKGILREVKSTAYF